MITNIATQEQINEINSNVTQLESDVTELKNSLVKYEDKEFSISIAAGKSYFTYDYTPSTGYQILSVMVTSTRSVSSLLVELNSIDDNKLWFSTYNSASATTSTIKIRIALIKTIS